MKHIPLVIVEYCSYKGLTLRLVDKSINDLFVEYCSYKGLTP